MFPIGSDHELGERIGTAGAVSTGSSFLLPYITATQLEPLGASMKGSAYGQYLLRVLADEV
jgi:hypothetical protein